MSVRLIVFDLDGTLAKVGEPILFENVESLKRLEDEGIRIAICSGKPTYYLCGMFRQVGLKEPIFLGENGGVLQFGIDLPPKRFAILPYAEEAKRVLSMIKKDWESLLPEMWYQPNLVGVTPFPKHKWEFEAIEAYLADKQDELSSLDVYRFVDCFDLMPKGVSKRAGVAYLSELLGILPEEIVAVGDGANDYPMFAYAGRALGIQVKEPERVDVNFETLAEALEWIENT